MNIYFINRKSKWRGPFDVIDAKQKHIISVGDVCIYDTDENLCFLIVVNDSNNWSTCHKAGVANNSMFNSIGNTLLFAFDSINHRHGNIKLLQEICECFDNITIRQFFSNACEILRYKKDFFDSEVILNLYKTSCFDIPSQKSEKSIVTTNDSVIEYPSIFTAYFDHDIIVKIITQVKSGMSLREVYTSIREYHPSAFRDALTRFLRDNPNKSIYDVPVKIKKTEKPPERDIEDPNPSYEWYLTTPSYIDDNLETNQILCDTEFDKLIDELETGVNSQTNVSKSLTRSVNELKSSHQLSENYLITLLRRYRNGDLRARDLIIEGSIQRVYSIALSLYIGEIPLEDLIQEGYIGLIYALDKFDYLRFRSFFNYVQYWIYRYIRTFLDNDQHFIRIPNNKKKLHEDIHEFADKYEQEYGIEPSAEEISIEKKIDFDVIMDVASLPYNLANVVEFSNDFDNRCNDDFLADDLMMQESLKYDVLRLVYSLPEREGDILINFYGLNGKAPQTLEEIGDLYGLTRERVRQIKEKAQRKLRIFLKVLKDEEIEEKASIKAMESRWKSFPGNQFSSFNFTNTDSKTKENKTNQNKINESERKPLNKSTDFSTTYLKRINTSHHYKELKEFLSSNLPQPLIKNRDNKPSELKTRLLQILKEYNEPMSLRDIYTEVNNKYFNWRIRIESVEYLLRGTSEIECTNEGLYRLRSTKQSVTFNTTKPEPAPCLNIEEPPRELEEKHEFTLSTPLYQLAKQKILTTKQVKQCRRKGLDTINDVYLMIQKHHLTPESTRFTEYTINMWFKIVNLVKSDTNIKTTKEVSLDNTSINYEDVYEKYTHKILKMHQAKVKGRVIVAKPILLLSVINGVDEGVIKYNRIILGDWLVYRYNTLMSTYNNGTSATEISMPFWYLKNDGFWHLHFIEDPKEKVYTPSMKWLNDNVKFASLDNELWLLLQNEKWRTKLRDFILGYKLFEKGTIITSQKVVRKKTSTSTSLSPKKNIIQDDLYDTQSNEPWTAKQEKSLTYFFNQGKNYETLAKLFGRTEEDIKARLGKLGRID